MRVISNLCIPLDPEKHISQLQEENLQQGDLVATSFQFMQSNDNNFGLLVIYQTHMHFGSSNFRKGNNIKEINLAANYSCLDAYSSSVNIYNQLLIYCCE